MLLSTLHLYIFSTSINFGYFIFYLVLSVPSNYLILLRLLHNMLYITVLFIPYLLFWFGPKTNIRSNLNTPVSNPKLYSKLFNSFIVCYPNTRSSVLKYLSTREVLPVKWMLMKHMVYLYQPFKLPLISIYKSHFELISSYYLFNRSSDKYKIINLNIQPYFC